MLYTIFLIRIYQLLFLAIKPVRLGGTIRYDIEALHMVVPTYLRSFVCPQYFLYLAFFFYLQVDSLSFIDKYKLKSATTFTLNREGSTQRYIPCSKVFKSVFFWANPGLFLFILVLFNYKFYRKCCKRQRDSASDRRSRRRAC